MRVFELSKETGVSSKALIDILIKMDIPVKSHMSALTEDDVRAVLKRQDILALKPVQKKSKSKKKAMIEPPPPPKKKRFVLRKKRIEPPITPPEIEGVVDIPTLPETDTVKEETPEPEIVLEPEIAPPAPKEGSDVSAEAPAALEEGREVTEILPPPPDSLEPVSAVSEKIETAPSAQPVAKPEEKKAEEKKAEQKIEPKAAPETKKDLGSKPKDKPKRTRRVKWTPAEGELAGGTAADRRKWQDFKPIHRRDDRKSARRGHGPVVDAAKPRKKVIKIYEGLTVKEFSELIGQKVPSILTKLMELGKMTTVNQSIGLDEASLIADAFEVHTEVVSEKTEEEILMQTGVDDPALRVPRPPVITIMGHVDHGKTSLLDAIRATKVTEGEAGGITQHIGAYMVTAAGKQVTFLDTPGHEAFTAMRARGAKVTDIVILVVAADDGVMPQTVEAVNHAKVAGVPIIVAINKMDRPEANPDRIKQALAEYELIPEDWGGDTIFAEVSAKQKTGLDHLLEMLLLQSEILELKANPEKSMLGTIVEARIEKGRGPVATVLVQEGTLKIGSAFVTGIHFGKVRALINDEGKKVKKAGPSTPVEVIGLNGVPKSGDTFIVVEDERVAKEVANNRSQRQRNAQLSQMQRTTLDDLYQEIKDGAAEGLNVIVKADVQGSVEAIQASLEKLSTDAVKLQVIHAGVGGITESDVMLAAASNAIILGFNIRSESKVRNLAGDEKVDIRFYTIIYEVISDVRSAMEGLLAPTLKERVIGKIEVRQTFSVPKQGTIVGGYVVEGVAQKNCAGVRVIRDQSIIFEGKLASLRRFKDDVKEVQTGYECGIRIEKFNEINVDDVLELYTFDEIATKLEPA